MLQLDLVCEVPKLVSQNKHQRRRVIKQNSGFVYVIRYSTGLLKVGQTKDLDNRFKQHRDNAIRQCQDIIESWGSPRHTSFAANEDSLISFCLKRYGLPIHGKETFEGADFADVVTYAESLHFPALTDGGVTRILEQEAVLANVAHYNFSERQRANLRAEVELINSLANDLNRWQAHDAHFSVAERLMLLTPAAWHDEDPEAVNDYLAVKTGRPADRLKAREFEVSMRALFAMDLKREPQTFAELAAYIDSFGLAQLDRGAA
jgi:hypothetical protein